MRLIQTGNIGVTEYLDKPDNKKWISDETFNQLHCKEVFPGDILISRLPEPAGRACIIPHLGTKMITAVDCTIVRTSTNTTASFLVQYLSSQPYFNEVNKCLAGGTRQRISRSALAEFKVLVPSEKAEQDIIGKVFDKFDILITLHQRKLEKLQATKKALLYELFPIENSRRPKLRFKGFTGDWEQRKLGEIFEYLQNNTLSRDSLNYKNPNVKNIHYGDILVKFDEILDGSNKDIPYINSEVDLSKFSKSLLRDGDIIFSDTAEDDTVGKAIELQNVNAPFILSGLHTIPCRPLIPFGKGYLGNFLNSDSYRLQLRPLVQGIKVSSISKSALKDTMIEYPKNLDEQEKIGSLFYYIAKMITLHQEESFLHKYML